jgi:hypothetical protein
MASAGTTCRLLQCEVKRLARLRHSFGAEDRPFVRVDRKWPVLGHSDAVDPKPNMGQ